MFLITRVDHWVLTVSSIPASCDFYTRVLGMVEQEFGNGRKALLFGQQKINLHQAGQEFEPKAQQPTPGSADVCLITLSPISDVLAHLARHRIAVEDGPVDRTGALGPMESIYIRDPDKNLIEISRYIDEAPHVQM